MSPKHHLFLGLLFFSFLLIISPKIGLVGFLIMLSSTVLIDIDHYLYYVYKKKDFSLKNSYNWFVKNEKKIRSLSREQREEVYGGFYFLHGAEILFFLFLGVFLSKYFLFIFLGFSFHLLLDLVYQTLYWKRMDRISLIYDFFKFKKLKFVEKING